jgi:hypothetical protein
MHSLEFLRLNSDELLSFNSASDHQTSSALSADITSGSEPKNKKSQQNWNLVVDGANLLCYSALKVKYEYLFYSNNDFSFSPLIY